MSYIVTIWFNPQTKVPDDNDDLISFRENVVELIRDTVFLCGSLDCFAEVSIFVTTPTHTPLHHMTTPTPLCSSMLTSVNQAQHGMSLRLVCL